MIFLLRGDPPLAAPPGAQALCYRLTPPMLRVSAVSHDLFVAADRQYFMELLQRGEAVLPVKDGWYEDDNGGGLAVWGAGEYWEVRATPFDVTLACGPGNVAQLQGGAEMDVRGAIFGAP